MVSSQHQRCSFLIFCVQVTLVATAPLTNLAVAIQLDPSLPKKLKALYIMGGNTNCVFTCQTCMLIYFLESLHKKPILDGLMFTQRGVTQRCVGSLTSWQTQKLLTSSWTATPVPPTLLPGSSAAGTACPGWGSAHRQRMFSRGLVAKLIPAGAVVFGSGRT